MKRRSFWIFAASSAATAIGTKSARAQSAAPDPNWLTTALTPMGAERAGNGDGSIPVWTGGLVQPPLGPDQPIDIELFTDEQMLYRVDAHNLPQYQSLVPPGLQKLITKFGFSLRVFPSHRTAAAPQYVYDNASKNVTRAKCDPAGGRFGFTGAYGGPPFPILDTSDPYKAGAQLIWNHLTQWEDYSDYTTVSPAVVITGGRTVLAEAVATRFIYPYYDPNGSPEMFDGYYSKLRIYTKMPASAEGQERLVWHSTNVNVCPDITWQLLNGQGRVRKMPNEEYDTPNPSYNGVSNIDESQCFYGDPSEYDWKCLGKQEIFLPYNNNSLHKHTIQEFLMPAGPNSELMRWEKHRAWVVEATLHPGARNVLSKRRLYLDEDTWGAVLGEAYDADGNMTRAYMVPLRAVPSVPMVNPVGIFVFSLLVGDYVFNGNMSCGHLRTNEYSCPQPEADFDSQKMAASVSF